MKVAHNVKHGNFIFIDGGIGDIRIGDIDIRIGEIKNDFQTCRMN